MKKILYVTNVSRTVNTFFIPHLNMLVDQGYEVACACNIDKDHLIYDTLDKNVKVFDIPFTRNPLNLNNFRAYKMLCEIQEEHKYDIIHVHTPIAGVYTRLLKKKFNDIKIIYTAHGYHFYKGASKLNWAVFYNVEKYLSKYTDTLITINSEDYEVSKDFKCGRLVKMPGVGVDFNNFKILNTEEKIAIRKEYGYSEKDFIIIMVGEHNSNKNQIQLIKALQLLNKEYPNIKGVFIGDGEMFEENINYVKENAIENVNILGFKKNVNELINMSDVLATLSYREGLPKNVIEAMACGKPILGTRIRGVVDLVIDEKNGLLVNRGDVEATKEAILKLYKKEKSVFKEMGNMSYELSKQYEMDNVLLELRKMY